jgi:hypothetical protein
VVGKGFEAVAIEVSEEDADQDTSAAVVLLLFPAILGELDMVVGDCLPRSKVVIAGKLAGA